MNVLHARVLRLFNREIRGLHEAAYLLGVFALLSQVLALWRDRLLAHSFGAGETLDLYYAAFRIPDFLFVTVASLVSFSILVPFLSERLERSLEEAQAFVGSVLAWFFMLMLLGSALAYVLTPYLTVYLFSGFPDASRETLIWLTRLLLLQPFFLGLSGLFATITQVKGRFMLYALSPLLYNSGIIMGALFLYPLWGMAGLGVGVVTGALLHALVQLPFIFKSGLIAWSAIRLQAGEIRQVMLLALPRTLALSCHQLVLLAYVALASLMVGGSVTVFSLAFNLQSVPLAIIGASYSVAAFPTLAQLYTKGEHSAFMAHITTAARHIIFWSLPAVVLFIVLRAHIVRTILGSGAFDWIDTRLTAAALALFVLSLLPQALTLLFVRGYYAAGKTWRPFMVSMISATLAVVLLFMFHHVFTSWLAFRFFIESLFRVEGLPGTAVLMLPLSFSAAITFGSMLFLVLFQRDFGAKGSGLRLLVPTFIHSACASVVMGVVAWRCLVLFKHFATETLVGIFLQGLSAGLLGIAAGVVLLLLLGNPELLEAWRSLHRRFWRRQPVGMTEDSAL